MINFAAGGSSVEKGESLKDTVQTLSAYQPDLIVIRTPHVGAAELVAQWTTAAVVNAGDGKHEHPTQALLDVYTLRERLGDLDGRSIWIVGDVTHSRVARSNIHAFTKMGAKVTLCGPPTLIPRDIESLGCDVAYTLDGLRRGRRRLRAADAAGADDRLVRPEHPRVRRPATRSTAAGSAPARCSCTRARSTAGSSSPPR